ncbi:helix-turn-helix transcriptional regulator [Pelagicoccus sp. SDUM812002]|uniref:helix-turn-helix transcriptional regulator n=1 Tax=Pelagicoccus sp. SDUM812002 TaxID=3041266 RepID=UPI00280D8BFD|nr:helix-turn-helix transcriptional regulator [Pelagicoccus sp. SDUM812002]MDQ8184409.1 helix-turn-helix transcriptional regulator [Pelagicoccus sp. SDUM812002]
MSVFVRKVRHLETFAEVAVSRKSSDPLFQDAINMLIRLLVEETSNHSDEFDSHAYEALHAVENDLARKLTIAALAIEAGMAKSPFARCFRRMMNEPPIQYVIRRRREEAKRQIQQPTLPIEEIAINLGYSDFSFFRELFRKRLGYTAESLRENRNFWSHPFQLSKLSTAAI